MVRYKVVTSSGRNAYGKETFKKKSDAYDAIYYTNKGRKLGGLKPAGFAVKKIGKTRRAR